MIRNASIPFVSALFVVAMMLTPSVAFAWTPVGFPGMPFQDGSDGANGTNGSDGDPATDGTDGEDGGDGSTTTQTLVRGGNGGNGGTGGAGIDGTDADSTAQGGAGGQAGKGGNADSQISLNTNTIGATGFATAIGGNGGWAGSGGVSEGGLPDGLAGNGADGGNSDAVMTMINAAGSATLDVRATGGRGGGTFGIPGSGSIAGNGGYGSSIASLTTNGSALPDDTRIFSRADGGDGGSVSGNANIHSGNAGHGGAAFAASSLNITGGTLNLATSSALAVGGNGGSGLGANGIGGNGGVASGMASAFRDVQSVVVDLALSSGNGGNATLGTGGHGGDSISIDGLSGGAGVGVFYGLDLNAGDGGSGIVGGTAGDAVGSLSLLDANSMGANANLDIDARGGRGGSGDNFNSGKDGGSAAIAADIRDTGDIRLIAQAFGGTGGGSGTGNSGNGGSASLGVIYGESTTGSVLVNARASGGSGGSGNINSVSGDGFSVLLDNAVDGNATTTLSLVQIAIAGNAGSNNSGMVGLAGSGTSILNVQKSAIDLNTFVTGTGGGGADGGDGVAMNTARNLVGNVEMESRANGGNGPNGGIANGFADGTAVTNGTEVDAEVFSTGGFGTSVAGGNAFGNAIANHEGSGNVDANSLVTGGATSQIGMGGNATAQACAVVQGSGNAIATARAIGGLGAGDATASSWAESMTNAETNSEMTGGNGINGSSISDGENGGNISMGLAASGSAGSTLEVNQLARGGFGGTGNGLLSGGGGDADLTYTTSDINVGAGGNANMSLKVFGGQGGDGAGLSDAGNGGDATLLANVSDSGNIVFDGGSLGSDVVGGFGGRGNGTGNGGKSGDSFSDVTITSTGNGTVFADWITNSNAGGRAFDGIAGDGGDSTNILSANSNGGIVNAFAQARAGQGAFNSGTGGSGSGGDALAIVQANSISADVNAVADALGGTAGNASSGPMGTEGSATAMALAHNSFVGSGNGGIATASAIAEGRTGQAMANAITGNDVYRQIEIVSTVNVASQVDAFSQVTIGGNILFGQNLDGYEAGGTLAAGVDNLVVEAFLGSNQNIIDTFDFDLNGTGLTPGSAFGAGTVVGRYANDAVAPGISSVEVLFDIDSTGMNTGSLIFGMFDPEIDGGFDQLSLVIDVDGYDVSSFAFTDATSAEIFFTDNVIDLGDFVAGNSVTGSLRFEYMASAPNSGFEFNWVFGNSAFAVPEPTTTLLTGFLAIGALLRRRRV